MNSKCEINKKITNYFNEGEKFIFGINFDADKGFVLKPEEAADKNIFYDFEGETNFDYDKVANISKKDFGAKFGRFEEYKKAFDTVMMHIKRGDSFLINLTQKTELLSDYTLKEIFTLSNAKYKLLFKDNFVFFSPEPFIKIKNNTIESFPMKGTIDANIENAEEKIINDKKEFSEHTTIVDLIRNDLNIVSKNVKVESFRYVEKINSNKGDILQVSSKIVGEINDKYKKNLGDLIFAILPAGSISGAPKKKTVEIIKAAENYDRGFYTGISGYFNGKSLNTCVNIRFIEKQNSKLYYKSGGGITALSNIDNEFNEIKQKVYVPFI